MAQILRLALIFAALSALSACGGSSDNQDRDSGEALPPAVNAGEDRSAESGAAVVVAATVVDPDSEDLEFSWSQLAGPSVSLAGADTATVRFTAPSVNATTVILLRLSVDDGANDVVHDEVAITLNPPQPVNRAPRVDAGPDLHAKAGEELQLSASVEDEDTVQLTWLQLSGPQVQLRNASTNRPRVTLPQMRGNHSIVLRLSASDGVNPSVHDQLTIFMSEDSSDSPPVVSAGVDQTVTSGDSVQLQGTVSDDQPGVTAQWFQLSGRAVSIDNPSAAQTRFIAPEVSQSETLLLRLRGSDGVNAVVTDDVSITVLPRAVVNLPPTVNAGADQQINEGLRVQLHASASDDQGHPSLLWQQISGPAVLLSDATTLNPAFNAPGVDVDSVIVLRLSADDGVNDPVSSDVRITVINVSADNPPQVNAGADQRVASGADVSLGGSASDDGETLSVQWSQVSGPQVTLRDANTLTASFQAPSVTVTQTLVLRLSADDGHNPVVSDELTVVVEAPNRVPVVNAGADQAVDEGASVSLQGSVDDDDTPSLQWTQLSGPAVVLENAHSASAHFVAPQVETDSVVVLQLSADDGEHAPVTDQVSINVRNVVANTPPMVDAGADQTVNGGALVNLSGSVSDAEDSPALQWTQISGPTISLGGSTGLQASFTAPALGETVTVVLRLSANDGVNPAVSDEVVITVQPGGLELEVDAGEDQSVAGGSTVLLAAVRSGAEGELLWQQLEGPTVTLADATSPTTEFTAPSQAATLRFRVTLSVGEMSASDEVTISVRPAADRYIDHAAAAKSERLACYRGSGDAFCELRIYQVMVEAFIDGDSNHDYNAGFGTSHHKGDIRGITASLDYIKSLGMNAVWLTPVFYSDAGYAPKSATGYFATDYFRIDPNFGTFEQARELVNQAHAKGLYVFFDGVFGHYSSNVVRSPGGRQPETDGTARYPNDLAFFQEVAEFWIRELKIDGWRLDLAYEVPVQYWDDIRTSVENASRSVSYTNAQGQQVNPLGYMVAEVWRGADQIAATAYGPADSPALFSAFDFPMRYAALQSFAVEESTTGHQPASRLQSRYTLDHAQYPDHAMPNLMISNHDLVRFGDLLQRGRIANPDQDEYWQRHKTVFSFQAAYSGPITVYYGDEIGSEVWDFADKVDNHVCANQGKCDDHVARNSGRIEGVPTQVGHNPTVLTERERDLKAYVQALMAMRAAHPALYDGARTHIYSDNDIYIDRKDADDDHVLYLVNLSDSSFRLALKDSAIGSEGTLRNLLNDTRIERQGDSYLVELAAHTALFFAIESPTEQGPQLRAGSLTGEGALARCDTPDAAGGDPLNTTLYLRGSYPGGQNFAATPNERALRYKGDNLYQVVVREAVGDFAFKFANSTWSREFAAQDAAAITIGSAQALGTAAGQGAESPISIPMAGDYVYSLRLNATLDGGEMMVSLCR